MTVPDTFAALQAQLLANLSPTPQALYSDPPEGITIADFPAIILALAPGMTHSWGTEAMGGNSGLGLHVYTIAIYYLAAARQSGLEQAHSLTLPLSEQLFDALGKDVTLSGAVTQIGDRNGTDLFTYVAGPLTWGDGTYYGIKALLPIEEKPVKQLGP
jgi:hypothetical protein